MDPLNVPTIRKKIPKPFQRKRITVSGTKRDWLHVPATTIMVGDTVANAGIVQRIVRDDTADIHYVTLWCGADYSEERVAHKYKTHDAVYAFVVPPQ